MVKTDSVENHLTQFSEFCLATRSPILILLVKSSAIYGGASRPSIQFPLLSSFNCLAGEKDSPCQSGSEYGRKSLESTNPISAQFEAIFTEVATLPVLGIDSGQ